MTAAMLALALTAGSVGATSQVNYVATISDGIQYPARLAPAPGGGFYVTDPPMKNVVAYDANGDVVATYAIAQGPVGIAVHNDGRVFISREDGVIGVYSSAFVLLGTVNPAPMALTGPNDLAWNPGALELYTVDSGSHSVLVFSEGVPGTWTLARSWGMEGSGMGQFAAPQAIALDTFLGHILVTDADNFRVQVFDPFGILLFKFGYRVLYTTTDETAWFARAEGLAVDDCGNIYITDALMGTVRVFTATGAEVSGTHSPAIGYGAGAGQLSLPCDVMIDGAGVLYVANTNNGSVELFDVTCSVTAAVTAGESTRGGKMKVDRGLMADLETGRLMTPPDSPLEVIAALDAGEYSAELDLDRNAQLDQGDIEIAIQMFGAGTLEDFSNVASHPAISEPHILDMPNRCSRCHNMNGAPGGMLSAAGQENLCLSCHSAGKIAGEASVGGGHLDNSHPWGVEADIDPESDLALHLDNGNVRCATCHEPHESSPAGTCSGGFCEGGPFNGSVCTSNAQCEPMVKFMREEIYVSGGDHLLAQSSPNPPALKRMTQMDPSLCGNCHEDITNEWLIANHADTEADPFVHYDWSLSNRAACRMCHSGFGYIDFSNGVAEAQRRGNLRVIDCLVCHSTHGADQDSELLRIYDDVSLPLSSYACTGVGTPYACCTGPGTGTCTTFTFTDVGPSATCMTCHNGRRTPPVPNTPGVTTPHYLSGGVMLEGINGVTTFDGVNYLVANSSHTTNAAIDCTVCHMAPGPSSGPEMGMVGGHTYRLKNHETGFENVANTCATAACHPGLTTINRTANGDYDGNGFTEGVQDETAGLMEVLKTALYVAGASRLLTDEAGLPAYDEDICTGAGVPLACCTGPQTGPTCEDPHAHGANPYWTTQRCVGGTRAGLPCTGTSAPWNCPGGTCTASVLAGELATVEDALWNWEYVDNSGDLGVKNTGYAIGLLQIAYKGVTNSAVPGAAYRYSPAP